MTKDDANRMVFKFGECFRTMTPELGAIIAKGIEPYAVDVVEQAMHRHVAKFQFVVAAELFADIRANTAIAPADRLNQAKTEFEQLAQRKADERRVTDAEIAGVFARVERLTPECREQHKAEIIGELEKSRPFVAERLRDKDPQTSPMLASLIAGRIGGRT